VSRQIEDQRRLAAMYKNLWELPVRIAKLVLQARCPSCHPTNSVKAETQHIDTAAKTENYRELTVRVSNNLTSMRTDHTESVSSSLLTTDVIGRPSGCHGDDITLVTSSTARRQTRKRIFTHRK